MTISTPDLHRSPPITLRHVAERQPWLLVGAVALAVVLGILAAIDGGRLLVWDRPITNAAVEHRSPGVDRVALWVSRLGSTPVVAAPARSSTPSHTRHHATSTITATLDLRRRRRPRHRVRRPVGGRGGDRTAAPTALTVTVRRSTDRWRGGTDPAPASP